MSTDQEIMRVCSPFTMTSPVRQVQTLESIKRIVDNSIPGDIIEIGVWRGGTIMIMLMKLLQMGVRDRHVHLYDTFAGMTEPGQDDIDPAGNSAIDILERVMCRSSYDEVVQNVASIEYPMEYVHFHVGDIRRVQDIPREIAILRLDNDWYELYKFELPLFEPRVSPGGVVTIDDYFYWGGCKKAVDEYILEHKEIDLVNKGECTYWVKS